MANNTFSDDVIIAALNSAEGVKQYAERIGAKHIGLTTGKSGVKYAAFTDSQGNLVGTSTLSHSLPQDEAGFGAKLATMRVATVQTGDAQFPETHILFCQRPMELEFSFEL